MSLLAQVLPSCARVAEAAQSVRINPDALAAYALRLEPHLPEKLVHSDHHLVGEGETSIAYFLMLDCLNFGSGFFDYWAPYSGETGYFAVARALKDWMVATGPPPPEQLRALTPEAMAHLFHQDHSDEKLAPLLEWFSKACAELAGFLEGPLQGRYSNIIELNNASAPEMVEALTVMPMFRDVVRYDGQDVVILKRAMIFVHDLAIALDQAEEGEIKNLDQIAVFADNILPFFLEANGVLDYAPELKARIASGEVLTSGEPAEVELRACSIHASELLRQAIAARGMAVTARDIDFALWNLGTDLSEEAGQTTHICKTWFY
ncbi:MAG: hypothetical protein CMK07_16065 [Ponticaulis sp.]|nr:hypothetical protein [Ponticaulis sp.]